MEPSLPQGSLALFRRSRNIRVGDIVVTDHPRYGRIVKRVAGDFGKAVLLEGLSDASVEAEKLGRIAKSDIRGRLIVHW